MSSLHDACRDGDTERVRQLLEPIDAQDERTVYRRIEVDEKDLKDGRTALMWASLKGHTGVVRLLLDKGAAIDEKDWRGDTALIKASENGHPEVVQLLLGKGAPVDEKSNLGSTALVVAGWNSHTEVVQLLFDKGAPVDEMNLLGRSAVPAFANFDEEQLGRMAAALVHRQLLKGQEQGSATLDATATAVLQLVRLAGFARARARKLRSSDPHSADDYQVLFVRLQLAAAACVQNDESGKARDDPAKPREENVHKLFRSNNGRKALEHAVQVEAKELLAQPVVQGYIKVAWRGPNVFSIEGWLWGPVIVISLLIVLLQLLLFLPLVALVPPLEPRIESWLNKMLTDDDDDDFKML